MSPEGTETLLSISRIHRAMQESPRLEPRTFCIELHPPSHKIVRPEELTKSEASAVASGQAGPANSAGSKNRRLEAWVKEKEVS